MAEIRIGEETRARQMRLEDELFQTLLQIPYSEISVSDLCERTGVSRKSFYRYYGNKDGCLGALLDRALLGSETFEESFQITPGMMLPNLVEVMEYWTAQKPLLDMINANNLQPKLLERCLHYATRKGPDSLHWLGIRFQPNDQETAIFAITGFVSLLLTWSREGFPKAPNEMAQILHRIWTQPLIQTF